MVLRAPLNLPGWLAAVSLSLSVSLSLPYFKKSFPQLCVFGQKVQGEVG